LRKLRLLAQSANFFYFEISTMVNLPLDK